MYDPYEEYEEVLGITEEGEFIMRGNNLTVRDKDFNVVYEGSFATYASATNFFYETFGKGFSFTVE